jgi:uncharacterized membrane protein
MSVQEPSQPGAPRGEGDAARGLLGQGPQMKGLPVDRELVRRLYGAGILSPEARDAAMEWLRPKPDWAGWTSRMLLGIGAALVLSGAIYFLAFNWARIPAPVKLALPQAGVALCAAGAAWKGLERLPGRVLLTAAMVLAGASLTTYGQVYQTGADAWELFAGWAALTAGFAIVGRFAPLWTAWLAVLNLAVGLGWAQRIGTESPGLFVALAVVDAIALAGVEGAIERGARVRPMRWIVLAAVVGGLTVAAVWGIVDFRDAGLEGAVGLALLAGLLPAAYWRWRRRSLDPLALTIAALGACTVVLTAIGRVVFEVSEAACAFLFFGFIILGVVGVAVAWLLRVAAAREAAHA